MHATMVAGILVATTLAPFADQGYGFSFRYPPLVCEPFDIAICSCLPGAQIPDSVAT